MPQPRTKRTEQLERRQRVARLYLQGKTLAEIGAVVQVHYSTVSRDLEWIRGEWLDSAIRDFDEARSLELAKIDALEREYWEAWQRSQKKREVSKITRGPDGDRTELRQEQMVGNPLFLAGVERCIAKRCELLGLNTAPAAPLNTSQAAAMVGAMDATISTPSEASP